jgi:polysaccharide biosynthesis/export protein
MAPALNPLKRLNRSLCSSRLRGSFFESLIMFKRSLLFILLLPCALLGQDRKHIPITMEDVMRQQALGSAQRSQSDLNDRLRAMTGAARFSQEYLLGPGDVIDVTVYGIEDLKQKTLTLDSQGRISLPFIKEVQLIGLTARESEVKIATLFEASVLKNPQVSVNVKEYKSQFVNILGAVMKPGTYQLTRRAFLVDALAMAGGLVAEKAEPKAVISRPAQQSETEAVAGVAKPTRTEVDLVELLEKGDVSLNVPVYAGDVISVPERVERFYYVLGDVNRGGAFEIKKGERITVSKALASAGGTMPTAKMNQGAIMRQNPDGTSSQIAIDIKKILRGELKDPELAQNDVVFVPGSTTKTIGRGLLNSIGGVLAALVYVGF